MVWGMYQQFGKGNYAATGMSKGKGNYGGSHAHWGTWGAWPYYRPWAARRWNSSWNGKDHSNFVQYKGSNGKGKGNAPKDAKGLQQGQGSGAGGEQKEESKFNEKKGRWNKGAKVPYHFPNRWTKHQTSQPAPQYKCYDCGTEHDLGRYWKPMCRNKKCRAPFVMHLSPEDAEIAKAEWEAKQEVRFNKAQERKTEPKLTQGFAKTIFNLVGEMEDSSGIVTMETDDEEGECGLDKEQEDCGGQPVSESVLQNELKELNASLPKFSKNHTMTEALKKSKDDLEKKIGFLKKTKEAKLKKEKLNFGNLQKARDLVQEELEKQEAQAKKTKDSINEKRRKLDEEEDTMDSQLESARAKLQRDLEWLDERRSTIVENDGFLKAPPQIAPATPIRIVQTPLQLVEDSISSGDPIKADQTFQLLMEGLGRAVEVIPDPNVKQHISTCIDGIAAVGRAMKQQEVDADQQLSAEAVATPSESSKSLAAITAGKAGTVVGQKVASINQVTSKQHADRKKKDREDKKKKRAGATMKPKDDNSADEADTESSC